MPEKTDDGVLIKSEADEVGSSSPRTRSKRHARRRSTWKGWLLSNLLRLATWYSIITVLFRCPTDTKTLTSTDPKICQPYLSLRNYADPYLEPYYEQYASPYVEKARPYLDTANTRVLRPATVLATSNYDKYAAPQLAKAKDYTSAQWEAMGLPHLRKAQVAAQQVYDNKLAPHVNKASEVATPYYETARDGAFNVHENHIIPALAQSRPYIVSAYVAAQQFAIEKGVPFARHVFTNIVIFVDGTLWPFVRRVYADNVRPQLVMIRERIAKYQEGRKLQSAMEEVYTPSRAESISSTESDDFPITSDSVPAAAMVTPNTILSSTTTVAASSSAAPQIATDETVSEDLVKWQKKFAEAADKGTDDLRERIADITTSLAKHEIGEGEGLSIALSKTVEVEIDSIQAKVKSVVIGLPEDASSQVLATAEGEIVETIRAAAGRVKEAAKKVRAWEHRFDANLQDRLELATESTLHVLDDIRDLGLQEIGMRWAWMDGITYKHWQKYHNLKKQFADWRSEVRDVALSHQAASDARANAERLLEEAMAVTEQAAQELIRLRGVAKWKLAAHDATDDFETREIPVVQSVASAAAALTQGVKEAVVGTASSASAAATDAADELLAEAAEAASETVDDQTEAASSAASSVGESFADTSSTVSTTVSLAVSSVLRSAGSSAGSFSSDVKDAVNSASSALVGSTQGTVESVVSEAATAAELFTSSFASTVSSMASAATIAPSDVLSSASSASDVVSSSAASAIASSSSSQALKDKIDEANEKATDVSSSFL